jgi:hypothetical protein
LEIACAIRISIEWKEEFETFRLTIVLSLLFKLAGITWAFLNPEELVEKYLQLLFEKKCVL